VDIYFTALYTDLTPMPLGTYTATLKVGNNDPVAGTPAVLALMHIVEEFVPPTAGFESNSPVCLGEEMVFTNLSVPGVPPETDYTWDFGDGQTSVEENPTHVYAAAGVYTVELEACNAGGCDTYSADVEVLALPVAGFDYSVSVLEVTFTNLSTDADTYAWDFGDGGTSTEENPVHTYLDAGTYTVVLTATNSCGEDVYSADVEVVGRFYLYLPIVIRD
jgi:PKD repeat protein